MSAVLPNTEPVTDYRSFWPYYLREHAKSRTRAIHIFGTTLATVSLAAGIGGGSAGLVLAALVLGYGPAWFAHAVVEKNRPTTFRYPLWSFVSDLRMTSLWLSGRLHAELERAGIERTRTH